MATKDLNMVDINQQELEDMTTCCICTEVYDDPKALPCIHTFCIKCLTEHGLKSNKGPGDQMPCPICRRMFTIPTEGFRGIPRNFLIERLLGLQVPKVSNKSEVTKHLCSVCLENKENTGRPEDTPTAESYCTDCKRKLCKECGNTHRKATATKNHKLIEISEYPGDQNVMTNLATKLCEVHHNEILDVYCADCTIVVCAICLTDGHRDHSCSHVDKVVASFRKQIESNVEAMHECISKAQTKKAELLVVKEDLHEMVAELEGEVFKRKDELKQLIDKHASSLVESICPIRQSKLKEIQMAADDTDTYVSKLETYTSFCQKIMAEGSAHTICGAFSNLSFRATGLQQQCQSVIEREIEPFNLRFRKSDHDQELLEASNNIFGEIQGLEENQDEVSGTDIYGDHTNSVGVAQKDELVEDGINRTNLYIKNLDASIDDEQLEREFSAFGTVTGARVMREENGRSKGFGFVSLNSPDEAARAMAEMHGRRFVSKHLHVALALPKAERRAQVEAQYRRRNPGLPMPLPAPVELPYSLNPNYNMYEAQRFFPPAMQQMRPPHPGWWQPGMLAEARQPGGINPMIPGALPMSRPNARPMYHQSQQVRPAWLAGPRPIAGANVVPDVQPNEVLPRLV